MSSACAAVGARFRRKPMKWGIWLISKTISPGRTSSRPACPIRRKRIGSTIRTASCHEERGLLRQRRPRQQRRSGSPARSRPFRSSGRGRLDVTDPEPLPKDDPLWQTKGIYITPHISGGYHLQATHDYIARIAVDNLERFLAGEKLENMVDMETAIRPDRSCYVSVTVPVLRRYRFLQLTRPLAVLVKSAMKRRCRLGGLQR